MDHVSIIPKSFGSHSRLPEIKPATFCEPVGGIYELSYGLGGHVEWRAISDVTVFDVSADPPHRNVWGSDSVDESSVSLLRSQVR